MTKQTEEARIGIPKISVVGANERETAAWSKLPKVRKSGSLIDLKTETEENDNMLFGFENQDQLKKPDDRLSFPVMPPHSNTPNNGGYNRRGTAEMNMLNQIEERDAYEKMRELAKNFEF